MEKLTINRLSKLWRNDSSAVLRKPVKTVDIASFERLNGVKIPEDYLGILRLADGFDEHLGYQDERGFNFWPLRNVVRLADFEQGRFSAHGIDDSYFLFCDYLDFSWGYAMSMAGRDARVVLVGAANGQPKVVSSNFCDFIESYLSDADSIYL